MKNSTRKVLHDVVLWFGVLCFVVAVFYWADITIDLVRVQSYINRTEDYSRTSEMLDKNGQMLFRLIWVWVSTIPVHVAGLIK